MQYLVVKTVEEMSSLGADIISKQLQRRPDSVLGLATGSTPLRLYQKLIERNRRGEISFAKVHTINLDEYCGLSGDNPDSYRYYMDSVLFDAIDIDKKNAYVPNGIADDFEEECRNMDRLVDQLGGLDLQLLGIGPNGHIGFNEPEDRFRPDAHVVELTENTREANSIHISGDGNTPTHALTMGMRRIMQANEVLLIAGQSKRGIIEKAIFGPISPAVPASILQLHKNLTVILAEE